MVQNRRPITIYNIGGCISKAYGRSFSVQNITKGFQVTEIYPLNEGIFGDDEFLPSYVTDRPINNHNAIDKTTKGTNELQPSPSNCSMSMETEPQSFPFNSSMSIKTVPQPGPSNETYPQLTPRHNPKGTIK